MKNTNTAALCVTVYKFLYATMQKHQTKPIISTALFIWSI